MYLRMNAAVDDGGPLRPIACRTMTPPGFSSDAAFSKKKAEANRELVTGALRSLGGHAIAVAFELGEERESTGPATLTADQLAERLMRDFGAEEIFESDESESED